MYARHLYFCEYLTLSRYKEVTINIHVSTRLANKQDHINALDEMDVADKLQLELLANVCQTPTRIEICFATQGAGKTDPIIHI